MTRQVTALTIEFRNPVMTIACVEALLSENVSHVLVVDNSDDDGESAARLRTRFSNEPRVELLVSARNLGFAAGINLGLAHLREKGRVGLTLLVNNDAVLVAGALKCMLAEFERDPAASLVYPTLLHAGRRLELAHYHRATGALSRRPWPGSFPFVSGCCVLLSPDLASSDLFDDTFFMYGEDVELSWRLSSRGLRARAALDAVVTHVGSAASGIGSEFYETHMVAGHVILAKRLSRGRVSMIILLACRAVTLTLRAAIRSVRSRSFIPFGALGKGVLLGLSALRRTGR